MITQFLPFYSAAKDRTLRQFIEALWCEGSLRGELRSHSGILVLEGQAADGTRRSYDIDVARTSAFARVRLAGPVRNGPRQEGQLDIATVAHDLVRHLAAAPEAVNRFVAELQNTAVRQAYADAAHHDVSLDSSYALQEAVLGDGHLYHPCYRSRIGFGWDDNLRYGPEFANPIRLVWLAIKRQLAAVHAVKGMDYAAFLTAETGATQLDTLRDQIERQGRDPGAYLLLPAHPWQWEHCVCLHYADWLADGRLLYLGEGEQSFLAQQSVRSLSPLDNARGHHIKLPLAIANSSADRILSDHHVCNAPIISEWLQGVCANDPFFSGGKRMAILAENIGITLAAGQTRPGAYGMLGAIWRTPPQTLLGPGEQVFPMTGLCTLDRSGSLRISPWLARHGAQRWVEALLEAVVPPFLHLMMAHGVLLEGHAQNTLLILQGGLPVRIGIRDLPGGLHYLPGHCTDEATLKGLRSAPAYRNSLNASTGFAFTTDEARNYLLEVLFFINLGELAHRLALDHIMSEDEFWNRVAKTVLAYQAAHPAMAQRHRQFDLLGPQVQLENLASRRLLAWTRARVRSAGNPLHATRQAL